MPKEYSQSAWLRLGAGGHSFNLGDPVTPELATAVLPEARGRGVGTLMMKRLILLASPRYPAIVLSVREANRASEFYRRLGFRETGRMKNRVGGNSLVMELQLSASGARHRWAWWAFGHGKLSVTALAE